MAYLELFSKRKEPKELQDLCLQAIKYCPSYLVWWKTLELEPGYEEKVAICSELIEFLQSSQEQASLKSHHIFETVMYLVRLEVVRGKVTFAISWLQSTLGSEVSIVKRTGNALISLVSNDLTGEDLCLLWMIYIYLIRFRKLPSTIFDPSDSGPSTIASKEPLIFDMKTGVLIEKLRLLFFGKYIFFFNINCWVLKCHFHTCMYLHSRKRHLRSAHRFTDIDLRAIISEV